MSIENSNKKSRFIAYVDEAGDEGFVFHRDGSGSTRWFVLTAVINFESDDLQMVDCLKETRHLLEVSHKRSLHFRNLRHEQRVPFIRRVGELNMWCINVAVYKPAIREVAKFTGTKNLLYRYVSRLLIERLSWLLFEKDPGGDCSTDIIFSDRANMSYDDIRSYVRYLLNVPPDYSERVSIKRNVIDPDRIRSVQHSQLAGLQIADAAATSVFYALNPNRYGETESRYLAHLAQTLYRRKGKVISYGMKFWPGDYDTLKTKIPQISDLEDLLF